MDEFRLPRALRPVLHVRAARQFEQVFNAYYLDKMNYGAYWEELNKERIESFLFNLDSFRATLASYPRAGNTALLAKLDELIAEHLPAGLARAAAATQTNNTGSSGAPPSC